MDPTTSSDRSRSATEVLVVGYGNTLRQDDGVGPLATERIEGLHLPGVSVLICAQLSPEHVAAVSRAHCVVFIDAALQAPTRVELRPIAAAASSHVLAHALEPPTILALTCDVYGQAPAGWMMTLPAVRLGFGEDISPLAQRGIDAAVDAFARAYTLGQLTTASSENEEGSPTPKTPASPI